jgi:hypothetical protein
VRVGIAKAHSPGMLGRPKFITNWSGENPETLDILLEDIEDSLMDPKFGVFFAFRRVFGIEVAKTIGAKGQFTVPPGQ